MPGPFYSIKLTSLLRSFLARSAFVSRQHGETLSHRLSSPSCLTLENVQNLGLANRFASEHLSTSCQFGDATPRVVDVRAEGLFGVT